MNASPCAATGSAIRDRPVIQFFRQLLCSFRLLPGEIGEFGGVVGNVEEHGCVGIAPQLPIAHPNRLPRIEVPIHRLISFDCGHITGQSRQQIHTVEFRRDFSAGHRQACRGKVERCHHFLNHLAR